MALIEIRRNPGESDEDFKRRYNREYRHAYYHAKIKGPRKQRVGDRSPGRIKGKYNISRVEGEDEAAFQKRADKERTLIKRAIREGADPDITYAEIEKKKRRPAGLTAEEMADLVQRPEESEADWKLRLSRDRERRFREKNPGRREAMIKANQATNAPHYRELAKAWQRANPDKVKGYQKDYLLKHPERIDMLIQWGKDNPDKRRAALKAWSESNRALLNAYGAAWRRQARIATPAWSDFEQIKALYVEARRLTAETGIIHHVDHIVPLQRKGEYGVCGLHTQRNLRVIPGVENVRKQAKIDHELLNALWQAERQSFPLPDDQV